MFSSIRNLTDEIKLEMGEQVILLPVTYEAIAVREGLKQEDWADWPLEVEHFLVSWCKNNVKGRWKFSEITVNQHLAFKFSFQKKSEAVRFKLTWGGQ